jgi:hypothetical protein
LMLNVVSESRSRRVLSIGVAVAIKANSEAKNNFEVYMLKK